MAARHAHYGWPLKMSDSNKDLYGEREILKNYIELKRNIIPSYTLCEVLRSLLISSRFLARQLRQRHTTVILISPYKHCISAKITNI